MSCWRARNGIDYLNSIAERCLDRTSVTAPEDCRQRRAPKCSITINGFVVETADLVRAADGREIEPVGNARHVKHRPYRAGTISPNDRRL